MPSPFPGMDPYLEDAGFWPLFHHAFVTCVRDMLQRNLPEEYVSRIDARCYRADEEHIEEYIGIFRLSDQQLLTVVEVVSPSNKTTAAGREAYLGTWEQGKAAGANLVEIDLVIQGQPMLLHIRDNLPDWNYVVTVFRALRPAQYEVYIATLQKRLPRFRVPLTATDSDPVLDLQSAFSRCYAKADLGGRIDYRVMPALPLSEENRSWIDKLLLFQRVRAHQLHDRIAIAAYQLWQNEGCPHGRDKEHWYKALEHVRGPIEVKVRE